MHYPDQIPEIALQWHIANRGAVLATVVETWGSAPRQAGSQLVIAGDGAMMGSVSGGCVEGAVVAEALEALFDGQPRILSYGVSDETAFQVGLACGGQIRILLEPVGTALPVALLQDLVAARAARQPVVYRVDLGTWQRQVLGGDDPLVQSRVRADQSGVADGVFYGLHNPPVRLHVVGAVHIAQALVPMARLAGFDVTVIDPRDAFGQPARFPGEVVLTDWPDDALARLGLDARTAVVTLTHDAKLDDPAIAAALRSDVFYLGCLGSTRTHAKRLDRLRALGFDEGALRRIQAPVGLPIGAKTPAEIAVAVLAQIIQNLRQV
jgi:xanthine dehydrogenase accessory factor